MTEAPNNWIKVDATTFKHPSGITIDIGETQGGFYRIDKVDTSAREPIDSRETVGQAIHAAEEWMRENPDANGG